MIDLCYKCIEYVNDERMPTYINHAGGDTIQDITHGDAMRITENRLVIWDHHNKALLPMLAVATVSGSRVCGRHVQLITAAAIRAGMRGR